MTPKALATQIGFALLALLQGGQAGTSQTADPSSPLHGEALLQAGKAGEARDVFESALAANPGDPSAQKGEVAASERIALDHRSAGHMADALQALLRAEKLVPQDARLKYDLGILEDEMHLYPEALKAFAAAEQLHLDDPHLLYAEGRTLLDQGQLGPAEEKMAAYLKLKPDDAGAHYGLGRIYQLGLQFEKAQGEFHASLRLQPQQTEAWYQLGDIALKQNQPGEAFADFSKTLDRDPGHGGALAGSGQACFQQKRYAQALEFLDRAIASAPDYQPGHYYRGLTLARLGRKEESRQELATAAKLADEDNKKASTQYQLTVPASNP